MAGNKMQWTWTGGILAFILFNWNAHCAQLTDVFTVKCEAASACKGSHRYYLGKQVWTEQETSNIYLQQILSSNSKLFQKFLYQVEWHNVCLTEGTGRSSQVSH